MLTGRKYKLVENFLNIPPIGIHHYDAQLNPIQRRGLPQVMILQLKSANVINHNATYCVSLDNMAKALKNTESFCYISSHIMWKSLFIVDGKGCRKAKQLGHCLSIFNPIFPRNRKVLNSFGWICFWPLMVKALWHFLSRRCKKVLTLVYFCDKVLFHRPPSPNRSNQAQQIRYFSFCPSPPSKMFFGFTRHSRTSSRSDLS